MKFYCAGCFEQAADCRCDDNGPADICMRASPRALARFGHDWRDGRCAYCNVAQGAPQKPEGT